MLEEADVSIAHHEAGHAIAAVLCGEQWTSITLDPELLRGWAVGVTQIVPRASINPANDAFIYWAGCWAEARSVNGQDDDGGLLLGQLQVDRGHTDMEMVQRYWDDASLAPHETEEQWAAEMEQAWEQVEQLAEALMSNKTIYTQDGQRIERDLEELI